jgi:hypothetical protein
VGLGLLNDDASLHEWGHILPVNSVLRQERRLWHSRVQVSLGHDWGTRDQLDVILVSVVYLGIINLLKLILILLDCL